MRAYAGSLGLFVPGRFTLPPQPAGIGDFVPARFSLPPQPSGIGDFVSARFTLPPQPAGIGAFVNASAMYPVPMNSVLEQSGNLRFTDGMGSLEAGKPDCGCGCGGACSGGLQGISEDFSALWNDVTSGNWSGAWNDFTSLMGESVFSVGGISVPVWMLGGAVVLTWALFFSGGTHSRYQRGRRASSAARRAYA